MAVVAKEHIRKMRGGANAHLMRASDDHYYVVKFRNNPQHSRILVDGYSLGIRILGNGRFVAVVAKEHIRKMRGGANAHLMRASDDHYYVVKFRNNPQHSPRR